MEKVIISHQSIQKNNINSKILIKAHQCGEPFLLGYVFILDNNNFLGTISCMKIENREFYRNYEEIEKLEVGIALTGAEVKSIRKGAIKLDDAYVKVMDNQLFLVNADISIYQFSSTDGYDARQRRKLLLHRKEITRLQTKLQGGGNLTIAPISCYTKGRLIKLEIALARGRTDLQKRKLEKARDIKRADKKEMKEYMKK